MTEPVGPFCAFKEGEAKYHKGEPYPVWFSVQDHPSGIYFLTVQKGWKEAEKQFNDACALLTQPVSASAFDHPAHYGGKANPYEAIKIIEALGLGFCLGNALKYIVRAGKKDPSKHTEDLEKARWYLDREIADLKAAQS